MNLKPRLQGVERPRHDDLDAERLLYLRSYLLTRTVIGFVGLGLPIALFVGDWMFGSQELPRQSLSFYYHTPMRDLFVGGLCVISVFLITYMFFQYNWDNLLSIVAGVAALGVAFIPSSTEGRRPLTTLQQIFGEERLGVIHLVCAGVFLSALAVISILFGVREGKRVVTTPARRTFWRRFHVGCGVLILVAVGFISLTKGLGYFNSRSTFFSETIAVFAFGASWLAKGLELEWLLGRRCRTDQRDAAVLAEEVAVAQQV